MSWHLFAVAQVRLRAAHCDRHGRITTHSCGNEALHIQSMELDLVRMDWNAKPVTDAVTGL